MKKIVAVWICLWMILSLSSCNMKPTNDDENKEDHANTTAAPLQGDADTLPENAGTPYGAVLANEEKVYDTATKEYQYLADCRTPYERTLLRDCGNLRYAYTDVDGDSADELVIDCGDTLILRYYEGTVYLYSFTFRQLSHFLSTDHTLGIIREKILNTAPAESILKAQS